MIQPPVEALKQRRWESIAILLLLTTALTLPSLLLLTTARAESHLATWLTSYHPVVYIQEGTSPEQITLLHDELRARADIAAITKRSPADALAQLQTSLGPEHVTHLGLSEAMLPTSLVITPQVPLHGHITLASSLAALEARPEVAVVDLPDKDALKLISVARSISLMALLLAIALLTTATILTRAFLATIQRESRRELELLELFGASRASLSRPTRARAMLLVGASGAASSLLLLLAQLNIDRWARAISGLDAAAPITWLVVASPLLLAPLLGLLIGRLAIGIPLLNRRYQPADFPGIRSLLHMGRPQHAVAP